MNLPQGFVAAHQVQFLGDEIRKGLWQGLLEHVEKRFRQTLDRTGVESHLLHLLRRVVIGLHAHSRQFQLVCSVDVRMGYIDASVVDVGTSEDDIFFADGVALLGIFPSVEPRQVHHLSGTIGKVRHDAFLAGTHLEGLETQDVALHLYEGHVAIEFADAVQPAAVDVFVRIILQQVAKGVDVQFFAEHLPPVRTNPRQVLYVLLQYRSHPISTSAIFRS